MPYDFRGGRGVRALVSLAAATTLITAGWAGAHAGAQEASAAPASARTAAVVAAEPDAFIRDVKTWMMTSEDDRTYKISVALPAGYSESGSAYRVLYVTDANAEFGIAVETARLNAPGTVVVGIGYDNPGQGFAASGVPRTLDLTPTDIGVATPSGGAPEFLSFLRDELVPRIEGDFHVDAGDRALMGHSFGGLFATYTLLHNEGLFQRFVIASPSLWWDEHTILDTENEYAAENDALDARVFLSVGSLEETTTGFPMTSDMTSFATTLADRGYAGLELGGHVFEDETHLSVIGASFSRGLRFIYAAPGTTVPGTELPSVPATAAPQVGSHPADVRVDEGGNASFAATATGVPAPTVQWQSRLSSSADWVAIPDATDTAYVVTGARVSATGTQYRAVFRNAAGEAITDAATLTVASTGEEPGQGGPSEEDLTEEARGTVTVPDSVVRGETAVVTLGSEFVGERVDVYLFSTPVALGERTVSAEGTVSVMISEDATLGAHRIAVYAGDGALLGWDTTTIVAPSAGAGAAAPAHLPDTGAEIDVVLVAGALLLLGAGVGLVVKTRARRT